MRKGFLILLIIIMTVLPLIGNEYSSNQLGQFTDKSDSEYVLRDVSSPYTTILPDYITRHADLSHSKSYRLLDKNRAIKQIDEFTFEKYQCQLRYDLNTNALEEARFYSDSRLIVFVQNSQISSMRYENKYDGKGMLTQTLVLKDSILQSTSFYYRNKSDNTLAVIRRIDVNGSSNDVLVSDSYIFQDELLANGNTAIDFTNEMVQVEKEEKNLLLVSTSANGITTTEVLNENGLVTEKTETRGETELSREIYKYSETSELIGSEKTSGDSRLISKFEKGKLKYQERFEGDEIKESLEYTSDEKIQTLYEFSQPYAIVVYDINSSRVKKVNYW